MPILPSPGTVRRLLLPVLLLSGAPAALAQAPSGAVVAPDARAGDPAELLAQALRTLAVEPNNLEALLAAGHNALQLGDPNAAVGFLGRAQGIAPRDGKIKAGLGSALVQLEKPQDALRLFGEASRLGVPDLDIAEDRGLAYDLTGDNRRAQRDYALVLAAHPDDEVARRRLALSQGMSGDRAAAIATLDPLIRKRDIAGWRAQTFVLAMTGDAKGASDITHIMLPTQADALQPFLVRLASLTPAEKARAVHFGEMPASGRGYTPAEVARSETPATYAAAPTPHSDLAPVRPGGAPSSGTASGAPVTLAPPRPAQAAQADADLGLPTPAAQGHYDLPHVAADRRGGTRSAAPLRALSEPVVGTPVVHGRTADDGVSTRAHARDEAAIAAAADIDCVAASAHATHGRGRHAHGAHAKHERTCTAAETRAKKAAARAQADEASADEDCTTVRVPGARHHGRKGKATTKTVCKAADSGRHAADKASAGKSSADGEDCTTVRVPGTLHHGKRGKATTKHVCKATSDEGSDTKVVTKGKASDDADCTTVKVKSSARHGKKGKATTRTVCKTRDGDGDSAKPAKGKATDEDQASDCTPTTTRAHGAKGHKGKSVKAARTTCTRADADDSATRSKSSHGKAAASDDADGSDTKSGKPSKGGSAKSARGSGIYVQVAGGANKADMDKAWAGVKKKAPELMHGKTPSTTPLRATNRLLVGPFKTEDEAQAFVNKMSAKGLSGFVFKSSKGQKVDKVDSDQ